MRPNKWELITINLIMKGEEKEEYLKKENNLLRDLIGWCIGGIITIIWIGLNI